MYTSIHLDTNAEQVEQPTTVECYKADHVGQMEELCMWALVPQVCY